MHVAPILYEMMDERKLKYWYKQIKTDTRKLKNNYVKNDIVLSSNRIRKHVLQSHLKNLASALKFFYNRIIKKNISAFLENSKNTKLISYL